MFGTFVAAAFADLSAILAHEVHILAITGHEFRGQAAESRAIGIQCNAADHPGRIFAFARFRATFTGFCTSDASVNAGLVMIMRNHAILLSPKFGKLRLIQTMTMIRTMTHTRRLIRLQETTRQRETTRRSDKNWSWKVLQVVELSSLLQLLGVTPEDDKQNGDGNPHRP
jgi:hypothetical protein